MLKVFLSIQNQEYNQNFRAMISYAGLSCTIIENKEEEMILKEISTSLEYSAPFGPSRIKKPTRIPEPEKKEYDPDDEVDPRILLDNVLDSESVLSLI